MNPSTIKPSIIFFGTGLVSLDTLKGIAPYFSLEAIVTKPNPEHHGSSVPPVKQWAIDNSVSYFQPQNKIELEELFKKHDFTSKVGLVVDYGLIIPSPVIDFFPLGIVNSHFSLLPKLRGADPITFAILEGAETTGVSLMLIVPAMDEGELLAQTEYKMPAGITIGQLTTDLVGLSNKMLIELLPSYIGGKITPRPQDPTIAPSYSRRLTKEDGRIDWQQPAQVIERQIRAYLGWPSSYTTLNGKLIKILEVQIVPYTRKTPGLICDVAGKMEVETGIDSLKIIKLHVAGKQPITGPEFLRGYPGSNGALFD